MTTEQRGAAIVARALQLLRERKARGWSHAIELARQQVSR